MIGKEKRMKGRDRRENRVGDREGEGENEMGVIR